MKERRTAVRYKLALPILIRRRPALPESPLFQGKTRDISAEGLYFTSAAQPTAGTGFEFTLELPLEITGAIKVLIVAQARAVRVESQEESELQLRGVGAVIERFEILRAAAM